MHPSWRSRSATPTRSSCACPVSPGSFLDGRTLAEAQLELETGYYLLAIRRAGRYVYRPRGPVRAPGGRRADRDRSRRRPGTPRRARRATACSRTTPPARSRSSGWSLAPDRPVTAPLTSGETALPEAQLPTSRRRRPASPRPRCRNASRAAQVNDTGERTSRTHRRDRPGQRASPASTRSSATMLAVILVVGPIQDAHVRLRPRSQRRHRHRAGGARQAHARPARGARTRRAARVRPRRRRARRSRSSEVVLDDLLELRAGDQVPCDGVVRDADGLEIDESLLTGESRPGRQGTPATRCCRAASSCAGRGRFQATAVGADSYAAQARRRGPAVPLTRSELDGRHQHDPALSSRGRSSRSSALAVLEPAPATATSTTRVARHGRRRGRAWCPRGSCCSRASRSCVAAVTLARRKVLVQELPAVEGLARVDVVCLDKTGTLTEGDDRVRRARAARRRRDDPRAEALGALAADENRNATLDALAAAFAAPDGWARTGAVPFSSARKWSAATLRGPRHLGDRRARDGARRPRPTTRCAQRADELAADGPARAACSRAPTRRSPARRCRRGSSRSRW